MNNDLTIRSIKNTDFNNLYEKFCLGEELNQKEKLALLKLAIIFLNQKDKHVQNFGYRILLMYSNINNDYKPLLDITINNGLIPVSKYIHSNILKREEEISFFNLFATSFIETYKKENIYLTDQQAMIDDFLNKNDDFAVSIIAPTSYGKSEIIIDTIKANLNLNICVIVPSKALLEQTKKRLIINTSNETKIKTITHPEMYKKSDKNTIAVLTQERLLRLLKKNKELFFDIVFIDEAHNILDNDERNMLLASVLIILYKRNLLVKLKFLTPFLLDSKNLKLEFTDYQIKEFKITEYIKSEKIYLYDFRNGKEKVLKFYDQFLDCFFCSKEDSEYEDDIDFIIKHSSSKNIIYFNRPKNIEDFTLKLISRFPEINSYKIEQVCIELKKHLHKDYYLIDAIKHGIIYHHGSIPSYIRLYIEHLFRDSNLIRYIITSSTLLEGVNIPAETLFLLDNKKGTKKLSPSQFRNLIGRVSRFSEVFSSNNKNLHMLEPKIYLVCSEYYASDANVENFIKNTMRVDKAIKDDSKNPLLSSVEINENNSKDRLAAENFITNFEEGIIENENTKIAKTEIGKLCFENNVVEIDIIKQEEKMNKIVQSYKSRLTKINDVNSALKAISDIFVDFLKDSRNNNLKRLQNEKARKFYSKFLEWKNDSISYNKMINSFLSYWKYLKDENKETLVYVGSKWGEEIREGHVPLWVDIKQKELKKMVNLAIVRISDEQDFLDNILFKFIDILFELEIFEELFYYNIKYGTSNDEKIILIKNGVSFSLAHLLIDQYTEYIDIDLQNEDYNISNSIVDAMKKQNENDIMIFEVSQHILN